LWEGERAEMKPTIEIIIDETGNAEVEAKGIIGNACGRFTAPYEKALGLVTEDQKKPEFHRQAPASQQQEAGQ